MKFLVLLIFSLYIFFGVCHEFVFDDYTLKCIEPIQKEPGIGTRKDAVKVPVYQLAGLIREGEYAGIDRTTESK